MKNLTKLERRVLEMMLNSDNDILASLNRQLDSICVTSREVSSAGFFTHFYVPIDCKTSSVNSSVSFKFGDVCADIEGLKFGAGFLLYVENGYLKMLEGYSYDEPWPSDVQKFELSYINGNRDLSRLKDITA